MDLDWVDSQHKTMLRWVNCKLDLHLTDLTQDLDDGLVLILLINEINSENPSVPLLTPVYSKPVFAIQKIENLNDFLNFCQLVLNIQICSISGENIIDGNLKLILGLIWSLFIYSTSKTLVLKAQSSSFMEIKSILLNWCNNVIDKRVLSIQNFNKDWSLQINRPDLIFGAIIDYYFGSALVSYDELKNGKKVENLMKVLSIAHDSLHLARLVDVGDFNCLVPDEKVVIFHILEWFKFFEVNKNHLVVDSDPSDAPTDFSQFLLLTLATLKSKHKYETKSLRLSNQLNSNRVKFGKYGEFINDDNNMLILFNNLNIFHNNYTKNDSPASDDNFNNIVSFFNQLATIVANVSHYHSNIEPAYNNIDLRELWDLRQSITTNLQIIGVSDEYQPPKSLLFEALITKLQKFQEFQHNLCTKLSNFIKSLPNEFLEHLAVEGCGLMTEEVRADYEAKFKILREINAQINGFQAPKLKTGFTPQVTAVNPPFKSSGQPMFQEFKAKISGFTEYNLSSLSFYELNFILDSLFDIANSNINGIIPLIPSKTILNRSESDFNLNYPSDESDDNNSVFDGLQKRIGGQLLGNCDKTYNLSEFLHRFEHGFKF